MQTLDNSGSLQAALDAFEKGYLPVTMVHGGKAPVEKWKRWEAEQMTIESIYERWHGTLHGVSLHCRDLVVFDVDSDNLLDFVVEKCGKGAICRTPRGGFHVHLRPRKGVQVSRTIRVKQKPVDLLAGNSLAIIPSSVGANGTRYEWLGDGLPPIGELPIAKVGWTRKLQNKRASVPAPIGGVGDHAQQVRRARAYIGKIVSISGERGHDACFRAACKLRAFGLTPDQALALLLDWNETNALPQWSHAELLHKVSDAYKLRARRIS